MLILCIHLNISFYFYKFISSVINMTGGFKKFINYIPQTITQLLNQNPNQRNDLYENQSWVLRETNFPMKLVNLV